MIKKYSLLFTLLAAVTTSVQANTTEYSVQVFGWGSGGTAPGNFADPHEPQSAIVSTDGALLSNNQAGSGLNHPFTSTPPYSNWHDMGTLGGNWAYLFGVNNSRQLVGFSETSTGNIHAFVSNPNFGSLIDVGSLYGGATYGYAINNSGKIAGYGATQTGTYHAYIADSNTGTFKDLGTLGGANSYAYAINNKGQVAGDSLTSPDQPVCCQGNIGTVGSHAFVSELNGGSIHDLGTLGGSYSEARSINDSGQVVGGATTAVGTLHAYLYDSNNVSILDLGTLGGAQSLARSINSAGEIVGRSDLTGFGYGTYSSEYTRVFEQGFDVFNQHAFIYKNGLMSDLNSKIGDLSSTYNLTEAMFINDNGQITAFGFDKPNFMMKTFLLTPVPLPAACWMFAPTALGLLGLRRSVKKS